MAKDLAIPVKRKIRELLEGAITVSGNVVPVYNTLAGVNAGSCWVVIEDYAQSPDSSKVRPMYTASVLIEAVIKGDDYQKLNTIANAIVGLLYEEHGDGIVMDEATAYVVSEPTITEIIDDSGSELYMRKQLRINLKLSPK